MNGSPGVQKPLRPSLLRDAPLPRVDLDRPPRRPGTRDILLARGPEGLAAVGPGAEGAPLHRHHHARRAPVAARHPGAQPRPAPHRPGHGAARRRALQPGAVGRRHLRRGHALPQGGSLDAAAPAARGHPQHPLPDAAARLQRGGLHQLPRQRGGAVRRGGGGERGRRLPGLRRPQLDEEHDGRHGGRAPERQGLRGRHVLHGRHHRSEAGQVPALLLRVAGPGAGAHGRPFPRGEGHGRAS